MAKKSASIIAPAPGIHPISMLHAEFQQLPCYEQIIARIQGGFSMEAIRSFIQDDHQEWLTVNPKDLIRRLMTLRGEICRMDIVNSTLSGFTQGAITQAEHLLDAEEEMIKLFKMQRERIAMSHQLEKDIRITNRYTGIEIRLGQELLTSLSNLRESLHGNAVGASASPDSGKVTGGTRISASGQSKRFQMSPKDVNAVLEVFNTLTAKKANPTSSTNG